MALPRCNRHPDNAEEGFVSTCVAETSSTPMPLSASAAQPRPRVLILGGEDVHARIELMQALAKDFELSAAGSGICEGGFPLLHLPARPRHRATS
jgi:hypothetical protein